MRLHILGICGTLMGSIALLARQLGHDVVGSDQNVYPPMSTQLEEAGIELREGYSAANLRPHADLIMIGNAGLPRGNPAVEYVLDQGLPYTSGAEWLGRYLLADRWVVAIAGTHGKTTTTSMVAWILEQADMSPGFLIGGVPRNFGQSARLGDTRFFVIEADEYDTSYFDRRSKFLHYRPRTLVLNNLEYDHADIFDSLEAIQTQFSLLLRTVPASGLVVHAAGDANLERVFDAGCWTPREAFGHGTANGWNARLIAADGSHFEVTLDDAPVGEVRWALTGDHNVSNALAAIAAARHAGVPARIGVDALCSFAGVKRRMEIIHQDATTTVYDDFAHHPTAIASTLDGLRHAVGNEEIIAVIEPGSHTMRKGIHETTLGPSTRCADRVIWFEPADMGWDMRAALGAENASFAGKVEQIEGLIGPARGRRHIVIMSNTGFRGLRETLVASLRASPAAPDPEHP